MNLCRNSVQALGGEDAAETQKCVSVASSESGTALMILVSDTGPGVPERARENLFKAFQGSMRPGGTGLGLAIAAELVRAHGGTIELLDQHPGSHFCITLPGAAAPKQAPDLKDAPDDENRHAAIV